MRRIGTAAGLIDKITEWRNIANSIDVVLRGRRRKQLRTGKYILSHKEEIIARLQKEIRGGTFRVTNYKEMRVTDGPKERTVQAVCLYERIGVNAVMNVIEKAVFGRFIRTTSASIKKRGMHDLKACIQRDIARDPEGTKYCYKFDVRKFYESIDQGVMMEVLKRLFKDPAILNLFENFVKMMPSGLSIGLRSSQTFGNLLLSYGFDHFLKDQCGVKYFYRYCDDGVILAWSKADLWRVRDLVHQRAKMLNLSIKPNERVFPISEGIDFLGYVIYPDYAKLRKRNKQNAARRLHTLKSKRRRKEITAALYGQCKHADCHHLFKRLTGRSMADYKRLSHLGLKPKYNDGKKRFDGLEVNLADLVGEEFVVVDFETDIVTKPQRREYEQKVEKARRELETYTSHGIAPPNGFEWPESIPKPDGKYLVAIKRNPDSQNETSAKVFTGDGDNKSILDQLKEQGLLGEILCSVKAVRCKGFNRYLLC